MPRSLLAALRVLASITALLAFPACSSSPSAKSASDAEEKSECVGGLCVHPDHVVARKLPQGGHARCMVIAWDGTDSLPPTARVAMIDDAPGARPGVFAAIDMPSFREGYSYPIAADPSTGGPGSASVFAVRVDPGVRFADHRFADSGDVTVVRSGSERIVVVKAKFGDGRLETASFVVPKAYNGCSSPGDL